MIKGAAQTKIRQRSEQEHARDSHVYVRPLTAKKIAAFCSCGEHELFTHDLRTRVFKRKKCRPWGTASTPVIVAQRVKCTTSEIRLIRGLVCGRPTEPCMLAPFMVQSNARRFFLVPETYHSKMKARFCDLTCHAPAAHHRGRVTQ